MGSTNPIKSQTIEICVKHSSPLQKSLKNLLIKIHIHKSNKITNTRQIAIVASVCACICMFVFVRVHIHAGCMRASYACASSLFLNLCLCKDCIFFFLCTCMYMVTSATNACSCNLFLRWPGRSRTKTVAPRTT